MRFQLWRRVGARPKDTLGTYARVGQVTSHEERPWDAGTSSKEVDPVVGINFTSADRTPIVPGDLLISARTERAYRVMSVEINIAGTKPWQVCTRQLSTFERFAKHRDYTQCTRNRRKHHEDPST